MSEEIVEETLFEFPCEFSIKAMGKFSNDLDLSLIHISEPTRPY